MGRQTDAALATTAKMKTPQRLANKTAKEDARKGMSAYVGGRGEMSLAALTARRADLGIILHSIAACRCLKQVLGSRCSVQFLMAR